MYVCVRAYISYEIKSKIEAKLNQFDGEKGLRFAGFQIMWEFLEMSWQEEGCHKADGVKTFP